MGIVVTRVSIRAAGVVIKDEADRIVAVHRPRRSDWSLPKGKLEIGESPIDAACREAREETGIEVQLGSHLPSVRYSVSGALKEVYYWVGRVRKDHGFDPDEEIDQIKWLEPDEVSRSLTYPHDVLTVHTALERAATSPLILLRHSTARKRADWHGTDAARPLRPEGLSESVRLVSQLRAFGIESIRSSDAERCLATVAPLARTVQTSVALEPALSEEGFAHGPGAAADRIDALLHDPEPMVVCTHRPILPSALRRIATSGRADPANPALDPRIPPGAFIVLHRSFVDGTARVVAIEEHSP